jgi:hypothetical protein
LSLLIISQKTGFSKKNEGAVCNGVRGKYVNFACCPFVAALYISNGLVGKLQI